MRNFLIFLLLSSGLMAQTGLAPVGGRSWGMGHAMVAIPQAQSFFYNPAGLGFIEQSNVNTSYDTRFDIAGLSNVSLSGVLAKKWATIAIGAEHFGDELYNENKAGIAIAKNTGRVSLGLKASYLGALVKDISSNYTVVTEFGIMATLSAKVRVGFHANNLTGASLFDAQKLPTTLRLGGAFQPLKKVTIAAETEYMINQEPFVKAGLEYEIHDKLFIRTGINSGIRTNHFGLGYAAEKWVFDYAVNTHPTLGFSHHMSLQLMLPKKL